MNKVIILYLLILKSWRIAESADSLQEEASVAFGANVKKGDGKEVVTNITGIVDSTIGGSCKINVFEKYSATFKARLDTRAEEFKEQFDYMVNGIRNENASSQDICFHRKYFLSCKISNNVETGVCACATENSWRNFKYEEVLSTQKCLVGKGGRCHPTAEVKDLLECKGNLTCTNTGKKYESGDDIFMCSETNTLTQSINFLLSILFLIIFYYVSMT